MTDVIWTTNDGRKIPVLWMTSSHLVNSLNMLMRKNQLSPARVSTLIKAPGNEVLKVMVNDIRARGLWAWQPGDQIKACGIRETPKQLCMLRALIDCHYGPETLELFRQNPDAMIEHYITCADPKWTAARTKFVEYRLSHEGT